MLGLMPLKRGLTVAGGLLLVACTSPTGGPTPGPTAATLGHGPVLTGSISVQGDFTIASAFSTPAQLLVRASPAAAPATSTCVDYARGFHNTTGFVAPEVHTAGDPNVYFEATVAGYAGPGTYSGRTIPGFNGAAAVTVGTPSGATSVYNPRRGGTTTLTVAADGSGSLTFSRWTSTEVRGGNIAGYLDGTVQWVCRSS